ncbi:MAG: hypothetical protein KME26_08440 [Oscillatoria princeps RMCB-10]|nr:hypothetical protein [Oscillatoria princeps RMCB-10]
MSLRKQGQQEVVGTVCAGSLLQVRSKHDTRRAHSTGCRCSADTGCPLTPRLVRLVQIGSVPEDKIRPVPVSIPDCTQVLLAECPHTAASPR